MARSVTKWTQACDRRLALLVSYIHFTSDYRHFCHVGNAAQHCRLGLFQDSDFAGVLKTQNQNQAEFCAFLEVEHLYRSVGCARSKRQCLTAPQNPRSYRWMLVCEWMVLPALDLWDLVIEVLGMNHRIPKPTQACTRETGVEIQSTQD